jgi:N-acetyl sugar amidotransferase
MEKEVQTCKRCILNSNVPDIEFDEQGICNYCKDHDELVAQFPQGEKGQQIVKRLVAEIKRKGKGKEYDCIVGVSGGTDSTYALFKTVELGLRPLAVLFDNGWSSEIAVTNIKNVTSKLNVDLETFVVDWEEFKAILVSFLKASVPDTDVPTDIGIKSTLYRMAAKYGIKYIITGGNFRTEGQIPRKWSYMDGRYIRQVYRMFSGKSLKKYPNLTMLDYIKFIFLKKIKVIRILNYVDYTKAEIIPFLEKELGWRDYGGKHYESIFTRFNQTYIRYKKFGFDMRLIEYAALVRSRQMSRNMALVKIAQPPFIQDQLEHDAQYVIKKLGLSNEEFQEIYQRPTKSFLDYPTYYPIIRAMRSQIDFISKFVKRL